MPSTTTLSSAALSSATPSTTQPLRAASDHWLQWMAIAAAGCGSATLFALEPFVCKVLLPRLGGSASVWNACMLSFQLLLLVGYAYSVLIARLQREGRGLALHAAVVVCALALSPLSLRLLWLQPDPRLPPALWIGLVVLGAVGLPFCVLSATSPLLQLWLTRRRGEAGNVHRLYAVTNLGNLAGLGLYVAVLEPLLGLRAQSWVLCAVSGLGLMLSLWVAHASARKAEPLARPVQAPLVAAPQLPLTAARLRWLLGSFAASFALFAVTTHLATDVAAFPLLFVLPLGLFLLGYALGYSGWAERRRVFIGRMAFVSPMLALMPLVLQHRLTSLGSGTFVLSLLGLFTTVTALALMLADARPAPARLPEYYAIMGAGGVLAGVVSVLVVPYLFGSLLAPHAGGKLSHVLTALAVPECPLALVLGAWLVAHGRLRRAGIALTSVCLLAAFGFMTRDQAVLYQARNFYGSLSVRHDSQQNWVTLLHGTTLHGLRPLDTPQPTAAAYYHMQSPIGQLIARQSPKRALVVGLGAGTLAAYARAGDRYDFLELDPSIAQLAEHGPWFGYVAGARERGAQVSVRTGDGRLLASSLSADAAYDLVVLDAFSSDSIPVHLLTREALQTFGRLLSSDGVLAVHVSNHFFDLAPVAVAAARDLGWAWATQDRTRRQALAAHELESLWVVLTPRASSIARLGLDVAPWQRPHVGPEIKAWTDDWANPLGSLQALARMR